MDLRCGSTRNRRLWRHLSYLSPEKTRIVLCFLGCQGRGKRASHRLAPTFVPTVSVYATLCVSLFPLW